MFFIEEEDTFSTMKVRDVMTTKVVTVKEDQTRQQAARLLAEYHISGVPVVNEQKILIGVVTEYDIIAKSGRTVGDIMTRGVISITPDTELAEAARILSLERIRRLPVLEQGQLVGVISRADLVKEVAMRWVCPVCGDITHSQFPPEQCPRCEAKMLAPMTDLVSPGF